MPRLTIASALYQNFMLIDAPAFLHDPYLHAQRALHLADTLLAAHAITDPREPGASGEPHASDRVEIEVSVRAAKAAFALQNFGPVKRTH